MSSWQLFAHTLFLTIPLVAIIACHDACVEPVMRCGAYTGIYYSHRKAWVEQHLQQVTARFPIITSPAPLPHQYKLHQTAYETHQA